MARRWYNEDYRKLYTRQDGPWLTLPYCARSMAADLIRWADERGVVANLEEGETPEQAIAFVVRSKPDEQPTIDRAVRALLRDGYLVQKGGKIWIKNYTDAQERLSQDAVRQRRKRDRDAQVTAERGPALVAEPPSVTLNVTPSVTPSVTPLSAVSRRDETRREKPLARDAGERASIPWTAASLEQLWGDTYRLPSSPGDLPQLSRMLSTTGGSRGIETPAFAAAFLGAFRDMLADWKRRGKHHGAPTTEGAISHFAAAVAWLDEHKATSRKADPEDNPYADELARNREAAKHRAAVPPPEALREMASDPESWRYDEASRTWSRRGVA